MKPFEVAFNSEARILAVLYMCWKYKFPASYFLSFYESFGAQTLLIFKALACNKKIAINDNVFASIIEDSKKLHKQILKGISTKLKIKEMEKLVKAGKYVDEDIPETPEIDLFDFTEDYKEFIETYLLKNVKDIFSEVLTLRLGTKEIYKGF